MTFDEIALPLVVGAMAANQLVMRIHGLRGAPWAFWPMQLLNLGVGSALMLLGLPGFEKWPVIPWILALFFFFRVVLNNNERQAWLLEQQEASNSKERDAVKEAFLDALRKGEEKADES
ncbi:MAG: hypothetical protein EP330_25675 [Deltaproteobacteria bacterium]|nr:MAG: hypothetical protein EP330_25675 [Deltaproteobacteria bacterium]